MFRKLGLLSLATVTGIAGLGGSAAACDRGTTRVVIQKPATPVVRVVRVPIYVQAEQETVVQVETVPPAPPVRPVTTVHQVPTGAALRVSAGFFGAEAGSIELVTGEVALACEVLSWSNKEVEVQLPDVLIRDQTTVVLRVFRADGSPAKEMRLALTPPSDLAVLAPGSKMPAVSATAASIRLVPAPPAN